MYYIDVMSFLEHPEKDWEVALEEATSSPPAEKLDDRGLGYGLSLRICRLQSRFRAGILV